MPHQVSAAREPPGATVGRRKKVEAPSSVMTEPAKLLLLASLLAQDRIITNNAKAFLKGP